MVEYDARAALIVVDVQNDFGHPEGSLYVRGGEEVVPAANGEITRAQAAGATLIYTQDWHPANTPHFEKDGGIWPVHCVGGSWGSDFLDGLIVHGEIIHKGTAGEDGYSAFTVRDPQSGAAQATRLGSMLEARGIARVVVVGIATDYCVKDTVLDARRLGYHATVLTDAIRAVNLAPGDGDRAIEEMRNAGAEVV